MKKEELRRAIKPMVKDCVYELLLEEGFLSTLISEVAKGLGDAALITERTATPTPPAPITEERTPPDYTEQKRDLMEAVGRDAYSGVDLFEGTTPSAPAPQQGSPMSGIDPSDRGVDISAIEKLVGRNWKSLV
jgi:hypothetical protein